MAMPSQALNAKAVTAQLERILNSADFNASGRLKNFLRFVVMETLKGNAGQIKAYTIAVTVFGRTQNFDPQTDPVVRIEAGKLRSKLEHFYYARAGKEAIRIDIPKGGYIPTFEILPSPSEAQKTAPAAISGPGESKTSGRPEAVLAEFPMPLETEECPRASIAVLPFVNLSRDERVNAFIDGLAGEITVGLTRFEDLRTVSSYSARQFREQASTSVCEIAGALGVRFVLHGSVQTDGDLVRVCAALTHADTGANIWAQRFDGNSASLSLFSIQEDITQKVVAQLGDSFGPIHRFLLREFQQDPGVELHIPAKAALCHKRWIAGLDPGVFMETKGVLEKAASAYPDSASTQALLAEVYASDYRLGFNTVPDALERAMETVKKAQRLDVNCQGAYWSEALIHYLRRDRDQFRRAVEQVMPLNPSHPFMGVSVASLLGLSGQISRAVDMTDRAVKLSPYSPSWHHIIPFMDYYMKEEYDLALSEALQINAPTCFWDPLLRVATYGQLGRRGEVRAAYAELLRIQPKFIENQERLLQGLFFSDQMLKKILGGFKAAGLLPLL